MRNLSESHIEDIDPDWKQRKKKGKAISEESLSLSPIKGGDNSAYETKHPED